MEFEISGFELDHHTSVEAGRARPHIPIRQKIGHDGMPNFNAVEQASLEEIKQLVLEPKGVSQEELAEWKVLHKKRVTNSWPAAQCRFYNIYESSSTRQSRIEDITNHI